MTVALAGLGLTLAACSGSGPVGTGSGAGSGAVTGRKVAFVVASRELSFAREMTSGFEAGVGEVGGVESEITGPDIVDGARQVSQFQAAVRAAPAGVSLFTLTPDFFVDPLTAASKQGVPVIAVDNPPPHGTGVGLFVGNDNVELGKLLARTVIDQMGAGATGTVVIGTSAPGIPVLEGRVTGIRAEFAALRPGIHVLGPFDTKQELGANQAAWEVLVKLNPRALAFVGTGDADGWHLAAIRKATRGAWLAGGFDLDPRSLAAVKSGDLSLVSPEHYVKGAVAGRLQAERAKDGGELPQGWLYVPGLAVTPANVDDIMARQKAAAAVKEAALRPQVETLLRDVPDHLRKLADAG